MKVGISELRSLVREEVAKVVRENHEPKRKVKNPEVPVYDSRPETIEPGIVWKTIFGNWRASSPKGLEKYPAGSTAGFKEDMYGAVHFAKTGEDLHRDYEYMEKLHDKGMSAG